MVFEDSDQLQRSRIVESESEGYPDGCRREEESY